MIYVSSLPEMPRLVRLLEPRYLVSLVQPEYQPATPAEIAVENHHRMAVHDISQRVQGGVIPETHHVEELIAFLDSRSRSHGVLIHCYAGISRSTAAALVALALDMDGREMEAGRLLRQAAPHAQPNRLIIALADRLLGREGRLEAAHQAMGPATLVYDAPVVQVAPRTDSY